MVASEAFNAYVKGAVAGAALGAALGAGTGAAIGAIAGRRGWAGRGAAIGAALGGTRGLFLGSARNRRAMERRVRMVLRSNQLRRKVLAQGMSHEGLIYFPAVNIQSVRVVTAGRGRQEPFQIDIPVSRPIQK